MLASKFVDFHPLPVGEGNKGKGLGAAKPSTFSLSQRERENLPSRRAQSGDRSPYSKGLLRHLRQAWARSLGIEAAEAIGDRLAL